MPDTADTPRTRSAGGAGRRLILGACLLSGAAIMVVELTTTRLLAPWFGASIYSWTNVIAVVLLALACGYAAGGRLADRRPDARVLGFLLLVSAALLVPAPLLARYLAPALAPRPEWSDPTTATPGIIAGSLAATLMLFGPPLVVLGSVTPFATRLLVDRGVSSGQAAGRTLAVSTIGSLAGTYLPALFLIEAVGSRGSILVAAGMLVVAGLMLLGTRGRAPAAAVAIAVAIAGAGALSATTPILAPTHGETVLAERESGYQFVRVARWPAKDGQPSSVNLSIDEGLLEFHSRKPSDQDAVLTGAYYDAFAVLPDWIDGCDSRPADVLILGGGAGTMRGMLRALQGPRVGSIVDVEIDPAVAAFSSTFGGDPSPRDRVLIADGRVALDALPGPFDLVVLDAYVRQIAIPAHLATIEAFVAVRKKLTPRGLFAINVSAADLESPIAAALSGTLRAVFGRVWSVAVPSCPNFVLLAGDPLPPGRTPAARGDALDPARKSFRRGFHELRLTPEGVVLTDDCAPLESLARRIR